MGCSESALEISALRWSFLRTPVLMVFVCTVKCLGAVICCFVLKYYRIAGSKLVYFPVELDVKPLLCYSLVMFLPLITLLSTAASVNKQVALQRETLWSYIDDRLSEIGPAYDESDSATIRAKIEETMEDGTLSWPGGKQLDFLEPLVLLILAACAGALPAALGTSLPQS